MEDQRAAAKKSGGITMSDNNQLMTQRKSAEVGLRFLESSVYYS